MRPEGPMNTKHAQEISLEFIALRTRVDVYESHLQAVGKLLSTGSLDEALEAIKELKATNIKQKAQLSGMCARLHGQSDGS